MKATTFPNGGQLDAERRLDRALNLLHARQLVLIRQVQRVLLELLLVRGPSTTDPVRALVPLPLGIDPRLIGAAVRTLALDGLIVSMSRAWSTRPEAHAWQIEPWIVTDANAARAWLRDHPELSNPHSEETAADSSWTLFDHL